MSSNTLSLRIILGIDLVIIGLLILYIRWKPNLLDSRMLTGFGFVVAGIYAIWVELEARQTGGLLVNSEKK